VNLELTDEQRSFRETTRRFIEATAPVSALRTLGDRADAFDPAWWKRAAALGWTSLLVPDEAGDGRTSARPVADAAIVAEEIGRQVCPGPFIAVNVVSAALARDQGRHVELLERLADGSVVATWAFAEPGSHWDADALSTTAVADGDGIVVDGTKAYVEAASSAQVFLVTARRPGGVSQVLVRADAPGVSVTPCGGLDLARRFGVVRFDAVRVPADAVVGQLDDAAAGVERQLQLALALQCAETTGILDAVFTMTRRYMDDRYAFGRPISSYQALKHRMADLLLWTESAKATCDGLVAGLDDFSPEAATLASVAKAYVGDKAMTIIQDCIQLHGGIGVTWEHDLHLYLRRATTNRALYGSPEQHLARLYRLLEREQVSGEDVGADARR
jgi:alkylation response protein AidB-like acyl-CoA dehydrogenase